MNGISNKQRALWMVLIMSLAAPFFAGLAVIALYVAAHLAGVPITEGTVPSLGEVGIATFAWSAIPATVAALGLTPYVFQNGTFGWLHAAVGGVIAFGVSTIIAPMNAGPFMPLLAFLAGVIAVAMRAMLIRGRILLP